MICGVPHAPYLNGIFAMLAALTSMLVGSVLVNPTTIHCPSGDQSGCVALRIAGSGTVPSNVRLWLSYCLSTPLFATTSRLPSGEYVAQPICRAGLYGM